MCSADTRAPSRTATSSRQTESPPPETSTRSGAPADTSPLSRAAESGRPLMALRRAPTRPRVRPKAAARSFLPRGRPAQVARLVEALQLHAADRLEAQMGFARHRLHHRVRHEHLAAAGAGHHSRGQVDLAAEVI